MLMSRVRVAIAVVLLGSITRCGVSYEEQETVREVERRQSTDAREQALIAFAARHFATPVKLFPNIVGDLAVLSAEILPLPIFTAQLQEMMEGSIVAFRGALKDVVRTADDNYHLVLGSPLNANGVATLKVDKQGAAEFMDDPPSPFSTLLVAARIEKVEPIILGLEPCTDPECGYVELDITPSQFRSIFGLPWFHVYGTVIVVVRE